MITDFRTLHKQFIALISVLLLSMCFLKPCSADPQQAFLKMNQYYVLFTNPIVPCIDKKGNFIVGLLGFSDLLGAKILLAKEQRMIAIAIKRAREIALLPFVKD